jgi:hypothetical protein
MRSPGVSSPWGRIALAALPAIVIVTPALVSLMAWLGPVQRNGLTGYFAREDVSFWGVALVVAWFGTLIAVAQFGWALGRRRGGFSALHRVSVDEVHMWAAVIGLIGTASAYWIATGGSFGQVVELWQTQQFNKLRAGFEYGVGIPTLRYAAILACAFTLAHLAGRGRPRLVDALSLVGLIGTSFLASRLALIATIFVATAIILARGTVARPRASRVVVAVIVVLTLFTALNYSRSAGTYREAGIENPVAMAAVNAQSYLASPTQVTLGFGTKVMNDGFTPSTDVLSGALVGLPTYSPRPTLANARAGKISSVVEVNPSLTTNGALPDLLFSEGWGALLAAVALVGAAGWGAGRFLTSPGIGPAIAAILLYGMAELWRIFLFNQGILHFLVLIGVAAIIVGRLREPTTVPASRRVPG